MGEEVDLHVRVCAVVSGGGRGGEGGGGGGGLPMPSLVSL